MHADVHQRAAALLLLVAEYAPAGDAAPSERLGAGVVDLSEFLRVYLPFQRLHIRAEPVVLSHHQLHAGLFRGTAHRRALYGIHGDRLFAQHVLACLKRRNGGRLVHKVRGAHTHSLNILQSQHIAIIREDLLRSESLRRRLGHLLVHVAARYDLHLVLQRRISRQMRALRNAAASDHAYTDLCHKVIPSGVSSVFGVRALCPFPRVLFAIFVFFWDQSDRKTSSV